MNCLSSDSILIKNGYILTLNPQRHILRDGAIYIEDEKIVEVGKTEDLKEHKAEQVIDAKNKAGPSGLERAS